MTSGSVNEKTPDHYRGEDGIQPFDIIRAFNLGFFDGNVIKYLCRAGRKTEASKMDDVLKAQHYLEEFIKDLQKEEAQANSNLEVNWSSLPGNRS